jgi:transposase InsO family protein
MTIVLWPSRSGSPAASVSNTRTLTHALRGSAASIVAPWRTPEQVEAATLHYVDWFNHQRLFETCGDIPPAELEAAYYRQNASLAEAG